MKIDWTGAQLEIGPLGRVRCEPGWHLDGQPGRFNDFDLWFVWAGAGEMWLPDRTLAVYPGLCLWMRPWRTYRCEQDPENRLGVTFIHFDVRHGGRRVKAIPGEVHEVPDFDFFDATARRVVELIRDAPSGEASRRLEAEMLLRGLLTELKRLDAEGAAPRPVSPARAEAHRKIRRMASELQENCAEAVSVGELAAKAGYSPVHFSRVFREVTGFVPREFIIRARIARARHLLKESSLSIGEIADALGYLDVFFFSRQFRERAGMSPTDFRNGL